MSRHISFTACLAFVTLAASAADLPPDKGTEIPESGKRPVVVTGKSTLALPKHDLPDGYTLSVAAASPLVTHPIMGCLDDRGRLFIGDGVGVNWNKAQLEANPPNRVLMLEDTDHDGAFDKSTVFADKMTFPQGAAWLNGSLYVCSPPGLWKLTDTDGDGVADKREMIVSGFEYTGNAADVHGPFLNPTNGRLYWCHGRKGHKVIGKEGSVVHEGLACGIWSCKPDGSDVKWHSLGCGDNPVEVDFTPSGDIIGVQNLYYTNPRGDTIVHWLYGGVYERSDQLKAIEGLQRTLEHMPVMYNFGHVAVSGSCFWLQGSAGVSPAAKGSDRRQDAGAPLQFMVTHFNTQRVVRMELTPDGGTYKATENEFLKLHTPDVHFTDVMEDPRDGSLLVIDTGGWFRIGCPSSLMAKSDLLGAIYRVKPTKPSPRLAYKTPAAPAANLKSQMANLKSTDAHVRRRALEWINMNVSFEGAHARQIADINEKLMPLMSLKLDPASEHALIAVSHELFTVSYQDVKAADKADSVTLRHLIQCFTADDSASANLTLAIAKTHLDSTDADLARVALNYVTDHPDADEWVMPDLGEWLKDGRVPALRLQALTSLCGALIGKPETQKLVTAMLRHASATVRGTALGILASQTAGVSNDAWLPALEAMFDKGTNPLLLDAIKKLKSTRFDARLQAIANDTKQPQPLRLKALDTMSTRKITGETFTMVLDVLTNPASSAAAKIQAADMMAHSGHTKDERIALSKAFATVGPVELKELLTLLKATKEEDVLRATITELAKNPALISQQESIYRTALADKPTDLFENMILPAYRKGTEAIDAKKRQLAPLADKALATGDAKAGREVYECGKGTCIACHQIGDKGRSIGPNLSHIGAIRTERDILESILFPSNTLARDYEAHIIETKDGQSTIGVIKSHTAEGLLVVDVAGLEKNLPHGQIVGDTQLPTSLMPMGLDQTLPEKDLLDLVAWLRSLK